MKGGCRVRSVVGPPPASLLPFSASTPGRRRPPASAAARGRSASFPSGSSVCAPGVVRDLIPGGGRGAPALPASSRRGGSGSDRAGAVGRVRGRCRGGPARPAPLSGASRVRPAPVRVPSCRVPARRFKDPGGVALPSPGSGGGGARRELPVGRRFPVPPPRPPGSPSDSAAPSGRRRSRGGGRGSCREPPLGARGARSPRPALPLLRPAGAGSAGVPCRVCPAFPSPTLISFSRVSFRFSLAGPRRAPLDRGGALCRRQHPRAPALAPEIPIRLLAVDHSARASMKNAASCEN